MSSQLFLKTKTVGYYMVQNANQFSRSHLRVVQQVADAINHLLFSAD